MRSSLPMEHECNENLYFRAITVQRVTKVLPPWSSSRDASTWWLNSSGVRQSKVFPPICWQKKWPKRKTSQRPTNSRRGHFSRLSLRLIRSVLQNGEPIRNTARNVSRIPCDFYAFKFSNNSGRVFHSQWTKLRCRWMLYTPDLAPKRNIRPIGEHIFPAISQKLHGSPLI